MAFESLSEKLQASLKKISNKKVSEEDLNIVLREIRIALLEADVSLPIAREIVRNIRKKSLGTNVLEGLNTSQQIVKIVDNELTEIMGGVESPLNIDDDFNVIMMAGLQGAGKTTSVAKIANRIKKNNKILFIAADVYRPAAIDQLETLGNELSIDVYSERGNDNVIEIVNNGLKKAKDENYDVVFIDTAGRSQIDNSLMEELKEVKNISNPNEVLLTIDAMTGQNAAEVANTFNNEVGVTGIVLTKLDGDTRGGAAISITAVTGAPIKFIGEGEKIDDIDVFHPDRLSSRILGMGDILSFIEKTQKDFDEKEAQKQLEKIQNETFGFDDFLDQLEKLQNMGPMGKLLGMIPGISSEMTSQMSISDEQINQMKAIVYSMTLFERNNPEEISPSRRRRISAGSGRPIIEVNKLLKQFLQMRKMMNGLMKNNSFASAGNNADLQKGFDNMDMENMDMGNLQEMFGPKSGKTSSKLANFAAKKVNRNIQKALKKKKRR